MSFYEELLTLGQWLQPTDKLALYRFFIETQKDRYVKDARILQLHGELKTFIANGEITYEVKGDYVFYTAKKKRAALDSSPVPSMISTATQTDAAKSSVSLRNSRQKMMNFWRSY